MTEIDARKGCGMELHVRGRNLPVTDALEAHAEKRMQKLERVLGPSAESSTVELELSVEHNPSIERSQIAEVTVRGKGPVMRVREADSDMYAAIDLAAHRIERQAVRLRERLRVAGRTREEIAELYAFPIHGCDPG